MKMLKKMGKVVKKAVGGGAVAAASKNMAPAMGGAVTAAAKPAVGAALQKKSLGKVIGRGLMGRR